MEDGRAAKGDVARGCSAILILMEDEWRFFFGFNMARLIAAGGNPRVDLDLTEGGDSSLNQMA